MEPVLNPGKTMKYSEGKLGRIFILKLNHGDRLPDIVESFSKEKNVSTALCFFLGGANEKGRIVVGPKESETLPPEPMISNLKGVHEACGIGTIFPDEDGRPKLHMHASFGRGENNLTGCIRKGIEVWQIGEIIIIETTDATIFRKRDDTTGFDILETK